MEASKIQPKQSGWKHFFIIFYTIAAILYIISILLVLFFEQFNQAPYIGTDNPLLKALVVVLVILSPLSLITSVIMLRKHSIRWAWLGTIPVVIIILGNLLRVIYFNL